MAYDPNFWFTLGDMDLIQSMAARGKSAAQIAAPLAARMRHRGEGAGKSIDAEVVVRLCDHNGIFVRTKEVSR